MSGSCGDIGEHSNDNANAQGICSEVGIRMSLNRKDEARQGLVADVIPWELRAYEGNEFLLFADTVHLN